VRGSEKIGAGFAGACRRIVDQFLRLQGVVFELLRDERGDSVGIGLRAGRGVNLPHEVIVDRKVEVVTELNFLLAVDAVSCFGIGGATEAVGAFVVFD